MNHSSAMSRPSRTARGRGRGLGDTRRETVEAAAAKARLARRRLVANGGVPDDDGDDDDDEDGVDAPNVAHDPDAPIFADAPYDEDDEEADAIYASVEGRMKSRRLKQTEARIQHDLEMYRRDNPTVPQQFADLKRKLSEVSEDDWAAVPDIGDRGVQKRRLEKYTPAPDALLAGAVAAPTVTAIAPTADSERTGGRNRGGSSTDLARIGEGKSSVIGHNLDTASDSVSGQTNIDPSGYLTQMAGMHITSDSEVSDIKKARVLLKSVTTTNPKHAPGWIAAARLEEVAGKLSTARALISEGCHHCPDQQDVWLEAARLHPPDQARAVLANAVRHVPKSVKVWLHATALERDPKRKKRVLRTALQVVPGSAKLWRTFVDLEDPDGARILLSRAVECVPNKLDLWLALARLETYDNAKSVLNRARQHLRAEPAIWVTSAKLEEAHAPAPKVESEKREEGEGPPSVSNLIARGVRKLSLEENLVKRERWLGEARDAEAAGFPLTCRSIIRAALGIGIDPVDQKRVWQEDASAAVAAEKPETARAIHRKLTTMFPGEPDVWRLFATFEQAHGAGMQLSAALANAVKYCPRSEVLWLMMAKEKWNSCGVGEARDVLTKAFLANPDSEAILLAAAKVETEVGETDRGRRLLEKARKSAPSARVYMKSALLERRSGDRQAEGSLLEDGLDAYPTAPKLWLMLAQLHERWRPEDGIPQPDGEEKDDGPNGEREGPAYGDSAARNVYKEAFQQCADSVPLWLGLARLEERGGKVTKARAVLEQGRRACRRTGLQDELWEASVAVEVRAGGIAGGNAVLARGLKECDGSGRLWALAIALESRARQRARSAVALNKRCEQNELVLIEAAKLLWRERKVEQAREWLLRAVNANMDWGDSYATLYAFEKIHGTKERLEKVENDVEGKEPRYGALWTRISKQPGSEGLKPVEVLRKAAELVMDNTLSQINSLEGRPPL